ncbi:MAG: hypothetical protein E5X15_26520 [Mesorhizobium sp.]|nr:MAG: hypothetical protein E5X15_26520 [Mesorhizobium sp.]
MAMADIRKRYDVPAKRGMRVEYTGGKHPVLGTITSATNGRLNIRLDTYKHPMPFHPTWELRYLTSPSPTASPIPR